MSHSQTAWLFDLDGTLYRAKPLKYAMAAELALLGLPAIKALRTFRRFHEVLRNEQRRDDQLRFHPTPFDEQLKRAADASQLSQEDIRRHVDHWMIKRPGKWMRRFARQGLIDRIVDFRSQGGRTALVSDYPASRKIELMGLRDQFDVIVSSGDHPQLHRLKPAPDGFLLAARELGVEPSDCQVFGDRQDADGEAARAAGMAFELIG